MLVRTHFKKLWVGVKIFWMYAVQTVVTFPVYFALSVHTEHQKYFPTVSLSLNLTLYFLRPGQISSEGCSESSSQCLWGQGCCLRGTRTGVGSGCHVPMQLAQEQCAVLTQAGKAPAVMLVGLWTTLGQRVWVLNPVPVISIRLVLCFN